MPKRRRSLCVRTGRGPGRQPQTNIQGHALIFSGDCSSVDLGFVLRVKKLGLSSEAFAKRQPCPPLTPAWSRDHPFLTFAALTPQVGPALAVAQGT
ncbi:hypothetical protein CB1_000667011 [Camelus ferus]|nr:hypothetical protein CB1_000667011 [Camelus ferus]